MTLPQNVKNAVAQLDNAMMFHADDLSYASWTAIRAHLLSQEVELKILRVKCSGTLANNLCPDHRDKQVGNPCLACTIEKLQSRLAAANALLRFMRTRFDAYMDDSDRASIDANLSENTHG